MRSAGDSSNAFLGAAALLVSCLHCEVVANIDELTTDQADGSVAVIDGADDQPDGCHTGSVAIDAEAGSPPARSTEQEAGLMADADRAARPALDPVSTDAVSRWTDAHTTGAEVETASYSDVQSPAAAETGAASTSRQDGSTNDAAPTEGGANPVRETNGAASPPSTPSDWTNRPDGYVRADSTNVVLSRNSADHIRELSDNSGTGWDLTDYVNGTAAAASDPVGYVRADQVTAVVYRSRDSHIREMSLDKNGTWRASDLSANVTTAAAEASSGASGYRRSDDITSVVYRSTDNHVWEFQLSAAGRWTASDLSGSTLAVAVASTPVGYVRSDGDNAVVYRGSDDHIWEISLPPHGGVWSALDLSTVSGATAATGTPVAYVRSDGVNAVVYRGADGHIGEIGLPCGGQGWTFVDVTAQSGAPVSAGDPCAWVREDGVNTVVYRSTDDHLRELSLPAFGSSWAARDLVALSGAPAAASAPGCYLRSDHASAIVYTATNNDVCEILVPTGRDDLSWKDLGR